MLEMLIFMRPLNPWMRLEIKFKDFVNWAFDKNMVIEFEKEKDRQTTIEFTEDQEVES